MSPAGWTDCELSYEWMRKVFVPQVQKKCGNSGPILLILDGHNSHTHYKFLEYADAHNIVVLCLPPHTTHRLQPCDVGVFGPLSNAWKTEVQKCFLQGESVNRYNLIELYSKARLVSFKPSTIQAAFRTTGIYPFNRNALPKEAYLPAEATTTKMNLPGPAVTLHKGTPVPAEPPTSTIPSTLHPDSQATPLTSNSASQPVTLTGGAERPLEQGQVVATADHTSVAPSAVEDLDIPQHLRASCIPLLLPLGTDHIVLWGALSETRQVALEMAKYIDTLTAWCKLYVAENDVLRRTLHVKKNKPKDHFFTSKARVLMREDQLAEIKKKEDKVRRKATGKGTRARGKKKGKGKGGRVPKRAVWVDETESESESEDVIETRGERDNEDYEPSQETPNAQATKRQQPRRTGRTGQVMHAPSVEIQPNIDPESSDDVPVNVTQGTPITSHNSIPATRRSTRQRLSHQNAIKEKINIPGMDSAPLGNPESAEHNNTMPFEEGGPVQAEQLASAGPSTVPHRSRRFKPPPPLVPGAPVEIEDDFFIRNPQGKSTARTRRR